MRIVVLIFACVLYIFMLYNILYYKQRSVNFENAASVLADMVVECEKKQRIMEHDI
jgi:hypothetical protein